MPAPILVVGGGHNGLVCAWRLARSGHAVTLLEANEVVGGCAVTEEFAPGFRNSVASYTVSLLRPEIMAAMELPRHGLRILSRPVGNMLPTEDGRALRIGGQVNSQAEIARFSARDAARWHGYGQRLGQVADVLRRMALRPPPALRRGAAGWLDLLREAPQALGLSAAARLDLFDLLTGSAARFLDRWFEGEALKACLAFDSVVGTWGAPSTPGSAIVLLHHVFGEVNGVKGAWGHAVGGMGAITRAMSAACREAGVRIRTSARVARVLVVGGRAVGVALESGEVLPARAIAAALPPKLLFTRLLAAEDVPEAVAHRLRGYASGSASFRMNVALSALPRFTALPEPGPHLSAGIILAPCMDYMERAFAESKLTGWSRQPVVEMLIPSTIDDGLAPPGAHVASLFAQHFAPRLPDGRSWDEAKGDAADAILDVVEQFAPGFRKLVVSRQILSPLDLERRFGLVDGDIFHGALTLDQLWAARPWPGAGRHATAIAGLYVAGAGAHPGGGVSGAPGWNAAQVIQSGLGTRGD
ncbi:MAG: phytoene desaturase family protein [Thermaurantiacus sp.]